MSKYNYRLSESDYAAAYKMYQDGQSLDAVGLIYGVSSTAIHGAFKRRGWICRSQSESQRRYSVNHSAFSEITESSAYWAGFIMADGTVSYRSADSVEVRIRLKRDDLLHLHKFRKFVSPQSKVSLYRYDNTPSCNIGVRSEQIARDLHGFGITPNKWSNAKASPLIIDNRHFWRGVIDGDGSIGTYLNKNTNQFMPSIRLVGSQDLLEQFKEFIRESGIPTRANVKPHRSIFMYAVCGKYSIPIMELLYKEASVYLDRKMSLAREIAGF